MTRRRLVVSLCGPSGSGKSTLANGVVAALGEDRAARLPTDWYLLPRTAGADWIGYRWDWDRVAADLAGADGTVIVTPAFDFERMRRDTGTGTARRVMPRPVMILDAMEPYPLADLTIRLVIPAGVRRQRLVERDRRWNSRVADRWDTLEASAAAAPTTTGELTLDGQLTPDVLTGRVVAAIERLIARG